MKKLKRNSILILLISIVAVYFLLKDDFNNTINALMSVNMWWLLLAIVVMLVNCIFQAIGVNVLIKRYEKKYTFKKALEQVVSLCKFIY